MPLSNASILFPSMSKLVKEDHILVLTIPAPGRCLHIKLQSHTALEKLCFGNCPEIFIFYFDRNHFFDTEERRRTKEKAKEGCVSTGEMQS